MKKISTILVLTMGFFVFGNAQTTKSKALEQNKVQAAQNSKTENLQVAPKKIENADLIINKKASIAPASKRLNTNSLIQRKTTIETVNLSKSKSETLKVEENKNAELKKTERTITK